MEQKLSRYVFSTPPFRDHDAANVKRLVFCGRSARGVFLPESQFKLLDSNAFERLPRSLFERLRTIEAIVPIDEDEPREVLRQNIYAAQASTILYKVILPSASCQLSCQYCAQTHSRNRLSASAQQELLHRVQCSLSTGAYKTLSVAWFGAEPLLALPVIQNLSRGFKHLCSAYGVEYKSKIATNGLLLSPKTALILHKDCDIREFEITIDGPQSHHDARRPFGANAGSPFNVLLDRLRSLATVNALERTCTIRCNVDSTNIACIDRLLEILADHGLQSFLKRIYTAPVHNWGQQAGDSIETDGEYAQFEVSSLAKMRMLGFAISPLPRRRPIVCAAVDPHAEVVDAYGNLFGCVEIPHVSNCGLGRGGADDGGGPDNTFVLGSLHEGTFPNKRERRGNFESFYGDITEQGYPCYECSILPLCGGGCPRQWRAGGFRCPSIKFNIVSRMLIAAADARMTVQH